MGGLHQKGDPPSRIRKLRREPGRRAGGLLLGPGAARAELRQDGACRTPSLARPFPGESRCSPGPGCLERGCLLHRLRANTLHEEEREGEAPERLCVLNPTTHTLVCSGRGLLEVSRS